VKKANQVLKGNREQRGKGGIRVFKDRKDLREKKVI